MRFLLLVEPLEGDAVQIDCHPNTTTIDDIKAQVEEKRGIPVDTQQLFFNGVELIKPNSIRSLCRSRWEDVTIQLLQSSEQYVAVKESCGKAKILRFFSDDTPLDILEKIKTETSSIHSKCLMFQGRELDCGSSLGAQSIGSGDTLHVVIKHRRQQVYVQTFNGGITVPCSPHDTITNLKAAIQMKEGIPTKHQHLLKFSTGMEEYKDTEGVPLHHLPQLVVDENVVFVQNKSSYSNFKVITLKYDPNETVRSIKQKIHRSMGIPPELQELTFDWGVLDDVHQLIYYKVKKSSTLHVKELYQGPISVELFTGSTVRVFIRPQDTIASVKEKLQEKCGIAADEQRLFFKGRELLEGSKFRSELSLLLVRQDSDIFYVQYDGSHLFFLTIVMTQSKISSSNYKRPTSHRIHVT